MIEEVKATQEVENKKVIEATVLAHQPESINIDTYEELKTGN